MLRLLIMLTLLHTRAARSRLLTVLTPALGGIMWRTAKRDVAAELGVPPQHHSLINLRLSAIERHFYQRQHTVGYQIQNSENVGGGVGIVAWGECKLLVQPALSEGCESQIRLGVYCQRSQKARGSRVSQCDVCGTLSPAVVQGQYTGCQVRSAVLSPNHPTAGVC